MADRPTLLKTIETGAQRDDQDKSLSHCSSTSSPFNSKKNLPFLFIQLTHMITKTPAQPKAYVHLAENDNLLASAFNNTFAVIGNEAKHDKHPPLLLCTQYTSLETNTLVVFFFLIMLCVFLCLYWTKLVDYLSTVIVEIVISKSFFHKKGQLDGHSKWH